MFYIGNRTPQGYERGLLDNPIRMGVLWCIHY